MSQADALYDQIQDLVGGRCYRGALPQEWTLPALTLLRVSTLPTYSQDGDSNLDAARWQISCWAETHAAAEALARQVRARMANWHAAYGQPAFFSGQYDVPQPDTGIYQVATDFEIWWKE